MTYTTISTVGMDRDAWLEARKIGLGGSDAAAVAGLSRFNSPLSVYFDKIGESAPVEENEYMYFGNVLEPIVADEFAKRTGLKIRRKNAILQSVEYPFMLANVDRMIVGVDEGLECKTASAYKSKEWAGNEIPWEYEIQCQHYMAVTGFRRWWAAALIGGNQFVYKPVDRDEDIIRDLIKIESDFWNNHILPRVPPFPDGSEASAKMVNALYPKSNGTAIDLPAETEKLVLQRDEAAATIKAAEEQKNEAESRLKTLLEDNEVGRFKNYKVTWKNVTSSRIDSKKLKAEQPDIFAEYAKESTSRRFEIKKEAIE